MPPKRGASKADEKPKETKRARRDEEDDVCASADERRTAADTDAPTPAAHDDSSTTTAAAATTPPTPATTTTATGETAAATATESLASSSSAPTSTPASAAATDASAADPAAQDKGALALQLAQETTCAPQFLEQRGSWMQLLDPRTHRVYYQSCVTYETQWEPPADWTALLTQNPELRPRRKIVECPNVPARRQVDPSADANKNYVPEGASEYNIWHDRWIGEHWGNRNAGPAPFRCDTMLDSGRTKGDRSGAHYHCFHFFKGSCREGANCKFLHHVPTPPEAMKLDLAHDVFGRTRYAANKEDMGGVGSFDSDTKTIYVGGIPADHDIEDVLWHEFGEWGELEYVRVIDRKFCAFIMYKHRANAEAAKVAMSDQLLRGAVQLNIRWAKDDPNPGAKEKALVNSQRALVNAAVARGHLSTTADQYLLPEPAHGQVTGALAPDQRGPMSREQLAAQQNQKRANADMARLNALFQT